MTVGSIVDSHDVEMCMRKGCLQFQIPGDIAVVHCGRRFCIVVLGEKAVGCAKGKAEGGLEIISA